MKKSKLALQLATIRTLTSEQLARVGGGLLSVPTTNCRPSMQCMGTTALTASCVATAVNCVVTANCATTANC